MARFCCGFCVFLVMVLALRCVGLVIGVVVGDPCCEDGGLGGVLCSVLPVALSVESVAMSLAVVVVLLVVVFCGFGPLSRFCCW